LIITTPVIGTTSVLIVLYQKNNLLESRSTCRTLSLPHQFIFSTYDQVFKTYRVCTSRSNCNGNLFENLRSHSDVAEESEDEDTVILRNVEYFASNDAASHQRSHEYFAVCSIVNHTKRLEP